MKYKVGDRVRIKSLDWYRKYANKDGIIVCGNYYFTQNMLKYCGKVLMITNVIRDFYVCKDIDYQFSDEMIEGLVEEETKPEPKFKVETKETKNNNNMEEKETLLGWVKESDSLRLVPHKDYEIKHDGDNFYLVKKKKEYPKTYEECCEVLKYSPEQGITMMGVTEEEEELFRKLIFLKRCRDAYWKLYGEEMKLGKPWSPRWYDGYQKKYCIYNDCGNIQKGSWHFANSILAFPTEELQDTFKENFDPDIEFCKEFL